MRIVSVGVVVLHLAILTASQFRCPYGNGFFPDLYQCDKYYECRNGKPIEHLCDDGYVFPVKNPLYSRCDYPFNVECGERLELQPAVPSKNCPRKFGIFPHDTKCDHFWQCVDGKAILQRCSSSLVFDPNSGECSWPQNVAGCEYYHINKLTDQDGENRT
ncbi:protein obstructor-E-like [Tachypleus tridentatus]|uniref:protein obstructor-E-like n=1 Tax=Tachypleus tridentatus TaxID=6853 RepID=UPI003FCF7A6A